MNIKEELQLQRQVLSLGLQEESMQTIFKEITKLLIKYFKVDRVTFYFIDGKQLISIYGSKLKKPIKLKFGEGSAGYVAKTQKPYYTNDAYKDKIFYTGIDKKTGYKTHSVLAVPIILKDKLFGVLELLNKKGKFTDSDKDIAENLARWIGLIIENKFLKAEIVQSTKLASVGELAAEIVHDIASPLTVILGNADLLLSEQQSEELQQMKTAALYIRETIRDLLEYSRETEMKFSLQNVNSLLEKVLKFFKRQFEDKKIVLVKNFSELPEIYLSQFHIQQVFINIIKNAIDAMPDGGKLTISTNLKEQFVELSFKDTGKGIEEENLWKVSQPFFSTKKNGTGLGLAVVERIIKTHRGEINLCSNGKGKGTEVIVKLPISRPSGGEEEIISYK